MSGCVCGSTRIVGISGKVSDLCNVQLGLYEHEGYVPRGWGIGGGDYLTFRYCLTCGRIQGKFPLHPQTSGSND